MGNGTIGFIAELFGIFWQFLVATFTLVKDLAILFWATLSNLHWLLALVLLVVFTLAWQPAHDEIIETAEFVWLSLIHI